ncbi:MAG: hypothetical protein HY606_13625 [Planctomycetes bacterium]|nr:hypothetical protein [Planctomycetota bacterium]
MRKNKGLAKLPLVWNKPIDPSKDRDFKNHFTKPLTLEELGGSYLTAGMRNFERTNDMINLEKLRQSLDQWHNPNLKPGESSRDLMSHNFGSALWLNSNFLMAKNWKEAVEEVRKRKLYIHDIWGIVPGLKERDKDGLCLVVEDDVQEYLNTNLGKYFIGWENGEHDGRWFWQVMRNYPPPVNREEAYRYFMGWFKSFFANLKNYVTSLCGLTFPHYFAQIDGNRMVGAEFIQALPSIPMLSAWVRGAARQYQMLWYGSISIFNFFGGKVFGEDKFNNLSFWSDLNLGEGNPCAQGGPDRGPSISLFKKTWYLLFMYGINIEVLEESQFYRPAGPVLPSILSRDRDREKEIAPEAKKEFLSPLGKMQLKATSFCVKNEYRRGVQYCPVAFLLDFYCGWVPPRHFYSDSFYTVWGGIPYEKGDHQIDLVFREVYPGYQDCPYFQNGRGYLTPTPYGDIADVLLSDVRSEILFRYQVVLLLGEISVKGELLKKLSDFVIKGGIVIWSLPQLSEEALKLSGIKKVGKEIRARESHSVKTKKIYRELPFVFSEVVTSRVKVLIETDNGKPLVISKRLGKGKIITLIVPYGITSRIPESHPIIGGDPENDITTLSFLNKPIGSPYRLLHGVKEVVLGIIDLCNLLDVSASLDPDNIKSKPERNVKVQYLTNLTDRPDKLIVTVINNEPVVAYLRLKVKGAKLIKVIDLMRDEQQLPITDGALSLTLFPGDSADFNIYILELLLEKPVMQFIESEL